MVYERRREKMSDSMKREKTWLFTLDISMDQDVLDAMSLLLDDGEKSIEQALVSSNAFKCNNPTAGRDFARSWAWAQQAQGSLVWPFVPCWHLLVLPGNIDLVRFTR